MSILRVRDLGQYRPRHGDIVINWGNSTPPSWMNGKGTIINSFEAVAKATNKLLTFQTLMQFSTITLPDWTTFKDEAQRWVNEGHRMYGRQTLTGHSGQGIVLFNQGDIVTPCPLYTKNTKAKYEFRIHVMSGCVIDVQQKKKREGFEGGIPGIRNHANGWVFCREAVVAPDIALENAVKAVSALGLDFGAVDIGYNQTEDKAYVYEVNTAPGLEGTTLERYVQAFKENYLDRV